MITAIVLTYNEEKHVARCLESLRPVCQRVVVIDSFSTDKTVQLATELGAEVLQRKWPNNHSDQLNWGIAAAKVTTPWTLRLDADEYLTSDLQRELQDTPRAASPEVSGYLIPRLVLFKGHPVRHGGIYPQWLLRLWRTGNGKSEARLMDEHIVVSDGRIERLKHDLIDENLNDINWWSLKHLNYARREAAAAVLDAWEERPSLAATSGGTQVARTRWIKTNVYNRMPLGVRAAAYFGYRFGLRLGVLDHPQVWNFHLLQGLWYRLLVDLNAQEFRDAVGSAPREDQLEYLRTRWNLQLETDSLLPKGGARRETTRRTTASPRPHR